MRFEGWYSALVGWEAMINAMRIHETGLEQVIPALNCFSRKMIAKRPSPSG